MKKVGLTTFYNAYNYGAFLQTYALYEIIKNKYEISIITYDCKAIRDHYKIIKHNNIKILLKSLFFMKNNIIRHKKFNKCINSSFVFSNVDTFYDVAIAGSDQIWNIELTNGYDKIYSLEKIKSNHYISYASSIGKEKLVDNNKEIYTKILNNIDDISVREESAKLALDNLTEKNIKVNLDPTLLLTPEEWSGKLYKRIYDEKYIFSYFVGVTEDNYQLLNSISKYFSMKVLSYSENAKENNILKKCYTDNPFEFITNINYADIVFTSSFHATVFSILFKKTFFCMPPKDKGNRIIDLLKKLGLESRIIYSYEEFLKKIDDDKINYELVMKKLSEFREDSIYWLMENLKK